MFHFVPWPGAVLWVQKREAISEAMAKEATVVQNVSTPDVRTLIQEKERRVANIDFENRPTLTPQLGSNFVLQVLFYNSALTKPVICASVVVEMVSPYKRGSFTRLLPRLKVSKSPSYSVRTLSAQN